MQFSFESSPIKSIYCYSVLWQHFKHTHPYTCHTTHAFLIVRLFRTFVFQSEIFRRDKSVFVGYNGRMCIKQKLRMLCVVYNMGSRKSREWKLFTHVDEVRYPRLNVQKLEKFHFIY